MFNISFLKRLLLTIAYLLGVLLLLNSVPQNQGHGCVSCCDCGGSICETCGQCHYCDDISLPC